MAAERLPGTSLPLFETRVAKGRLAYRLYACSVFAGICAVWVYRATHVPPADGGGGGGGRWRRAAWVGMLAADLWLGLYWAMSQSLRWTPTYYAFRDRLAERLLSGGIWSMVACAFDYQIGRESIQLHPSFRQNY